MTIDFGASWYFMNERRAERLDTLFTEALEKIEAYGHHTATTTALYKKEEKDLKEQIKQEYDRQMAEARLRYLQILKEQGDSEWGEHFASQESGIDAIGYFHQDDDESVSRRFSETTTYFHKSSLAQAYALLESELRMLCSLLQEKLAKRIGSDHLKGSYLDAIWTYLELVCELDMDMLQRYKEIFSSLGTLRNKIMHNGAMFPLGNVPKEINDAVQASAGTLKLIEKDAFILLTVKEGYLYNLYTIMESFFRDIFWVVDKKLGYALLTDRFRYFFAFVASDLTVSGLTAKKSKRALQIEFALHSEKAEFELKSKITIEANDVNSVEVVNQSGEVEAIIRLGVYIERDPSLLFGKILRAYTMPGIHNKVTLIIY
jgi:hypothetical protein